MKGKTIHKSLQRRNIASEYIDSDSSNQSDIAKKWNDSTLEVLITTTLGLVGNENKKTQMICIVGLLYNLPSIVQAYGRIRPKERCKKSICSIYTLKKNNTRMAIEARNESMNTLDELVGSGIVSRKKESKYSNSMTTKSVHNWLFRDQGCRLVSLGKRLGVTCQKCLLCDICTGTHISESAIVKMVQSKKDMGMKQVAKQVIQSLKRICIVCKQKDCIGNCIVQSKKSFMCFHCMGNHSYKKCPKHHKEILNGKACFSCYQWNWDGTIHDFSTCSQKGGLQERLRGLVQYDFSEKSNISYRSHLSGIYCSEESFSRFLFKYKDWK